MTTIGSQAFYCCTGLTSIEIPASVTVIRPKAFQGCTSLTSVTIYPPSLPGASDVFKNNASGRKIYVFSDCVDFYKGMASAMGVDVDDILPIAGISLKDAADNSSLITAADGASLAVTLQGRTLYKDGKWNTLCLPFDVTIAGSVLDGEGVDVRTLSSSDFSNGTLTLTFTPAPGETGAVTTLEAGKPYIIKWTKPEGYVPYADPATDSEAYAAWLAAATDKRDIHDPVFSGVTVSNASTTQTFDNGRVQFIGTYGPTDIYSAEKDNLYLGADNTLYYPWGEGMTEYLVNAFRAYFHVSDAPAVRQFVLNFGDGSEESGIISISKESGNQGNNPEFLNSLDYYTLDGVRLDAKPTKKGLYIHGGRKVVIP